MYCMYVMYVCVHINDIHMYVHTYITCLYVHTYRGMYVVEMGAVWKVSEGGDVHSNWW